MAAFEVDFAATSFARERFSMHWRTVSDHKGTVRDPGAMYWEAVVNNKTLAIRLTLHDQHLAVGSVQFLAIADYAQEALTELSDSAIIREYRTVSLPTSGWSFWKR